MTNRARRWQDRIEDPDIVVRLRAVADGGWNVPVSASSEVALDAAAEIELLRRQIDEAAS